MHSYFMNFHVKGEVAGTLLMKTPETKLLVDLSPETATSSPAPGYKYPSRVCFTLHEPTLISRFREEVSIGDVIEAHGIFSQNGYVPQGNGHVDTVFEMLSFMHRGFARKDMSHHGHVFRPPSATFVN